MSFLQRTDFTQSCITLSLKNRESTGIVQFCEYAWAEWLHKIKKKYALDKIRQNVLSRVNM